MARPINPVLPAFIDNEGRVIWRADSEARWKSITEFLRNQEVEISIGRRRRKRSSRQNRYYWGVIIPMLQEASGYGTPEEMHDALRHVLFARAHRYGLAVTAEHVRSEHHGNRRVLRAVPATRRRNVRRLIYPVAE
jgi:hypothetical protein